MRRRKKKFEPAWYHTPTDDLPGEGLVSGGLAEHIARKVLQLDEVSETLFTGVEVFSNYRRKKGF